VPAASPVQSTTDVGTGDDVDGESVETGLRGATEGARYGDEAAVPQTDAAGLDDSPSKQRDLEAASQSLMQSPEIDHVQPEELPPPLTPDAEDPAAAAVPDVDDQQTKHVERTEVDASDAQPEPDLHHVDTSVLREPPPAPESPSEGAVDHAGDELPVAGGSEP